MVHMDGNQLLAHGLDEERRDDGGVDTAGEGEEDLLVADLRTQFLDLFIDEFLGQCRGCDPLHVGGTNVSGSHVLKS